MGKFEQVLDSFEIAQEETKTKVSDWLDGIIMEVKAIQKNLDDPKQMLNSLSYVYSFLDLAMEKLPDAYRDKKIKEEYENLKKIAEETGDVGRKLDEIYKKLQEEV